MGLVAAGRLDAVQGLGFIGGVTLMLPWTRHKDRPMLVGATIPGSGGYRLLAFLAGMFLRSW